MKPSKNALRILAIAILGFVLFAIFGIGDTFKGAQDMRLGIDIRGGVEAIFEPQGLDRTPSEQELESARTIIETRLDAQKITDREVTVDKDGGYIIVRFPWKSDETEFNPEDAISELGEMARLTFRDEQGNILIEGKNIKSAAPIQSQSGVSTDYEVSLTFDPEGSQLFEEATGKMLGKQMGIYMDDQLIKAPTVETKISGGQAVIDHLTSFEEASRLAEKINAGALPFSLKTTNFSTISPTLGNHALDIMVIAGCIAFALVCIFMIAYYKISGIVACLALTLQVSLQLLALSLPQYTLTLPGIAGIILSLGMAVDANIIISERIAEELKRGISIKTAVKTGYKNAFSSVLDGNITTAIVAIILMIFGSGTMLSFGYTLLVGMILNLLVGVTVSRILMLSILEYPRWSNPKFFNKKKDTKQYHFYENKWKVGIISGIILIIGIVGIFVRGIKLDTQFTGGVVLSYAVSEEVDSNQLKIAINTITNRPVTVQTNRNQIDGTQSITVTLAGTGGISPEEQKEVTAVIEAKMSNAKVELTETYVVEPYIGAKALRNSKIAIILSIIFMTIYVWIRFSSLHGLTAGITAITALIHDVFVVFVTFVIFGIPLNDAFVAVILTIIGYSINDTIVLYDRIRENRKHEQKLSIVEQVNLGISQTLSRSINTSITTSICVLVILIAALIFQIGSITEFALPMFFGLISGCYSSVCIASILWAMWEKRTQGKRKRVIRPL